MFAPEGLRDFTFQFCMHASQLDTVLTASRSAATQVAEPKPAPTSNEVEG